MAKKRNQVNVRLSDEALADLDALIERMARKLGIELTRSDVMNAALVAFKQHYPVEDERPISGPLPIKKARRGRPPQKKGETP